MVEKLKQRIRWDDEMRSLVSKLLFTALAGMLIWYLQQLSEQQVRDTKLLAKIEERVNHHATGPAHPAALQRLREVEISVNAMRVEMRGVRAATQRIESMLNEPKPRLPEVKQGISLDYQKDA